jgi:hypothetical protein
MKFHIEVLSGEQGELLQSLGAWTSQQQFYLAGGTAVALYYGHRRSVDLDWFTSQPLGDALRLAGALRSIRAEFVTKRTSPGGLQGMLASVWMSFLEFRYPLLQPLAEWEEMGCQLAGLDDLACMKLSAIAQRGSRKDFYDVYMLVNPHRPLSELLALYRQKFAVSDITSLLYGLSYFDDAEEEPDPPLLLGLSWKMVKKRMEKWVKELSSWKNF